MVARVVVVVVVVLVVVVVVHRVKGNHVNVVVRLGVPSGGSCNCCCHYVSSNVTHRLDLTRPHLFQRIEVLMAHLVMMAAAAVVVVVVVAVVVARCRHDFDQEDGTGQLLVGGTTVGRSSGAGSSWSGQVGFFFPWREPQQPRTCHASQPSFYLDTLARRSSRFGRER